VSRHWNPDQELARAKAATLWALAETYARPAERPWSDKVKASLVLGAGLFVFFAAGLAQAL